MSTCEDRSIAIKHKNLVKLSALIADKQASWISEGFKILDISTRTTHTYNKSKRLHVADGYIGEITARKGRQIRG